MTIMINKMIIFGLRYKALYLLKINLMIFNNSKPIS